MSESRSEVWLKTHTGWGQFVLNILAYAIMVGWVSKGWSDQAVIQASVASQTDKQMAALAASVTNLSEQVGKIALANERLVEHVSGADQRMDRIERLIDKTYGNTKLEDWKKPK